MSQEYYITWCQGRYPRGGVLKRAGVRDQLTRLRVQRESRPLASLAPSQSYQGFSSNVVLSKRQHCWSWGARRSRAS